MVKYALKENKLGEVSKGCLAIVSAVGAATINDVRPGNLNATGCFHAIFIIYIPLKKQKKIHI